MPPHPTLASLRAAAAHCQACPLWARGTQTVFGEGLPHATFMLVGEQPGDAEDRQGRPFVGPAGRLLATALERVGIDRRDAYITNAVKHFKWIERGKRRIHQKPSALEVSACRPWLLAEIAVVRPAVLVLMGATAAASLLGAGVKIGRDRGRPIPAPPAGAVAWPPGPMAIVVTVHPSSILRVPDDARRHQELDRFVADLAACAMLATHPGEPAPGPG